MIYYQYDIGRQVMLIVILSQLPPSYHMENKIGEGNASNYFPK